MARILVIDDNSDIHLILDEVLTEDGHTVDCADDGKLGLALAEKHRYDLIITDIIIPNMDGIEVITEIKKRSPEVQIIAMTGGSKKLDKNLITCIANAMNVQKVIGKPLDLNELLATVHALLAP